MKKFQAILLSIILLVVPFNSNSVESASTDFIDLSSNSFGYEQIMLLVNNGIITGYSDNTFRPNNVLQRMHAAVLFQRALKLERTSDQYSFTDVPKTHAYYDAIVACFEHEIFRGSGGKFNPSQDLTREQMATLLVRAFDLADTGEAVTFKDESAISPSHLPNVKIIKQHGIATDESFKPHGKVTRADFAVFLGNAMMAIELPIIENIEFIEGTKEIKVLFNQSMILNNESPHLDLWVDGVETAENHTWDQTGKEVKVSVKEQGLYELTFNGGKLSTPISTRIQVSFSLQTYTIEMTNLRTFQIKFSEPFSITDINMLGEVNGKALISGFENLGKDGIHVGYHPLDDKTFEISKTEGAFTSGEVITINPGAFVTRNGSKPFVALHNSVKVEDLYNPELLRAEAQSNERIIFTFNEPIDKSNYSGEINTKDTVHEDILINGEPFVGLVDFSVFNWGVLQPTVPFEPGTYELTVQNVVDFAGKKAERKTVTFTID
ncbi:S-layer homology domain-containing protein [Bacillus salitolerans]|uniref:S-layer homology domain-containing protein n=1 Tax=Bacillus salitolerans TaxID=1437434 RepID=A0ABW4LNU8_9BACI